MDVIKQVFYWIEVIGKYGHATSKLTLYAKDLIAEIHPDLFSVKQENIQKLDLDKDAES